MIDLRLLREAYFGLVLRLLVRRFLDGRRGLLLGRLRLLVRSEVALDLLRQLLLARIDDGLLLLLELLVLLFTPLLVDRLVVGRSDGALEVAEVDGIVVLASLVWIQAQIVHLRHLVHGKDVAEVLSHRDHGLLLFIQEASRRLLLVDDIHVLDFPEEFLLLLDLRVVLHQLLALFLDHLVDHSLLELRLHDALVVHVVDGALDVVDFDALAVHQVVRRRLAWLREAARD